MKETQINNSPLFTVIIPSHNRAHLISKGINSVINQTFQGWELLFIDDGSADHTKEIVKSFQDQRIQYIYQEHAERSNARNKGIEAATGTYICFLDDDDYYLENHLELFYQEIVKQDFPVKIFRSGFYRLIKGKLKKSKNYPVRSKVHPVNFWALNFCGVWSLAIHKKCLSIHKFPPQFPHWQDTHLILRLLAIYPFKQIQAYSYVYVISNEMGSIKILNTSLIRQRAKINTNAIKHLFFTHRELLQSYLGKNEQTYLVSEKYLDYATGSLFKKDIPNCLYFLKLSFQEGGVFRHPKKLFYLFLTPLIEFVNKVRID